MRLTFLIPANDLSGGVRVAVTYAQQLQARGHEVLVVFPAPAQSLGQRAKSWAAGRWRTERKPPSPASFLERAGVPCRELDSHRPITNDDLPDADVVIATWLHCVEWMAALAPSKGFPVHLIQGDDRASLQFDADLVRRVEATWRLPVQKVAVSQWVAQQVRSINAAAEMEVIPNGVDLDLFNTPPRGKQREPRIGFVYATARCKGADLALAAIDEARQELGTLRVTAFGSTMPTGELCLPPDIEFVHRPPQECLCSLYGICDAWLFTSRAEGFGLPILEAMACRTPVIATPAGAAPELLAQGGGILVEPDSPTAIAAAITQIARMSEPDWHTLSAEALANAQQHTWSTAAARFESTLTRAACPLTI